MHSYRALLLLGNEPFYIKKLIMLYILTVQLNSNLIIILITRMCLPTLLESRTNDCIFASNSCGVTNLTHDWWKPSPHTSLLMSPTEEIQEQVSIAGTQDMNIKKQLQNGGVAWVINFGVLSRCMHYISN